jgi:ADP-ribose pyrophosphatase YjhB (NUDIX family)
MYNLLFCMVVYCAAIFSHCFAFDSMAKQAAGVVLLHQGTQRLLVVSKESDPEKGTGTWELPKGSQRSIREPLLETALREMAVETGLDPKKVDILDTLHALEQKTPFGSVTFFAARWQCSSSEQWWSRADADIKWARWLQIAQIDTKLREDQVCVAKELIDKAMTFTGFRRDFRSRSPVSRRTGFSSESLGSLRRLRPPPLPPARNPLRDQAYHERELRRCLSSSSPVDRSGQPGDVVEASVAPWHLKAKLTPKPAIPRVAVPLVRSCMLPPPPPSPDLSGLRKLWEREHLPR